MPSRTLLSSLVIALACTTTSGCGSEGSSGPGGDFALISSSANPTTLGTETTFVISMRASNFSGPVTLSTTGLPASWTVTFSPSATLHPDANGDASAIMTVAIPADGEPAPAGQTVRIRGAASVQGSDAVTGLVVRNEYIVPITAGTGNTEHWGALANTTLHLNVGTTLIIRNDDVTSHRVHTEDAIPGFPHQVGDMTQDLSYSAVLGAGTDDFSCHDHPDEGSVHLVVD